MSYWLSRTFKANDVLELAIDRTQWKTVNLLMISLIYRRRAIPIYFQVLSKKGQTNLAEQQLALVQVLSLLSSYKKVILGDREFCSVDLASWLSNQTNTYFCLRLRKNEYIEIKQNVWVQLQHLGVNPGISIYLKGVKVTKTKQLENVAIAARWKRKYRGWEPEEAWFILTNLENLGEALNTYAKRFGIEEMFRDFKSGGYNLEDTGVKDKRLEALVLLITLAYTSSILAGEKIENKGTVKYVCRTKEPKRTRRRHSNFYIGLHGREWIESLDYFCQETHVLMSLSPHKKRYYQRGQQAIKIIRSVL